MGVFGRTGTWWFMVKYVGYEVPEWNRNREHLLLRDGCRDSIRNFWDRSGLSPCKEFYEVNQNKCEVCGREPGCEYKRDQDLKDHNTKQKHRFKPIKKVSVATKKTMLYVVDKIRKSAGAAVNDKVG